MYDEYRYTRDQAVVTRRVTSGAPGFSTFGNAGSGSVFVTRLGTSGGRRVIFDLHDRYRGS